MDYELTEECYDILLEDFNEWSETYYQLFGIEGISGKDINVMYTYVLFSSYVYHQIRNLKL